MEKIQNHDEDATSVHIRQQWSLLLDGELSDEQMAKLLEDEEDLSTWHTYSLIGDVLRSSDLASAHVNLTKNGDFLSSFREKLKEEPLILAPAALSLSKQSTSRHWSRWGALLAASSFAVLIAIGVVYNVSNTQKEQTVAGGEIIPPQQIQDGGKIGGAEVVTAQANSQDLGLQTNNNQNTTVPLGPSDQTPANVPHSGQIQLVDTLNGQVWRDPRLDAYINAHQKFSHNPSLFVPANYTE